MLTSDYKERKQTPIVEGCLDYFPDALAAVSRLSLYANEKHNPGEPLHWSKHKSNDHASCLVRHLLERGTPDADMGGLSHTVAVAWRALALLQIEIEDRRARGLPALEYPKAPEKPVDFLPPQFKASDDRGRTGADTCKHGAVHCNTCGW